MLVSHIEQNAFGLTKKFYDITEMSGDMKNDSIYIARNPKPFAIVLEKSIKCRIKS